MLAVLVTHAPGGWTAPCSFEELFEPAVLAIPGLAPLVPRCSMVVLDLARLFNAELRARSLPALQKVTRSLRCSRAELARGRGSRAREQRAGSIAVARSRAAGEVHEDVPTPAPLVAAPGRLSGSRRRGALDEGAPSHGGRS